MAHDSLAVEWAAAVEPGSLTNQIVDIFVQREGDFVSGSELSRLTGVTRTAVWKHVRTLEDLGFRFESRHGVGYRLAASPDVVLMPLLARRLTTTELGRQVYWYRRLASTNVRADELARAGAPHGTLVTAVEQTGGKGRYGRGWFAPAGGLWWSLLLRRPFPLARAAELTLLAAVAVRRALLRQADLPVGIKWPNDLVCDARKLCGILAEVRAEGETVQYAVVGVGLNTNIPAGGFPEDLRNRATSVVAECGQTVCHVQLVADVLACLEPLYESLAEGGPAFSVVSDEWRDACTTLGTRVQVRIGTRVYEGVAADVDDQGVLSLRTDDGSTVRIHSGEVLF
ncbi:MAG: biotin--[acetyl-CoA-carboxylase] ligase [Alicyclobacillaceae bacterium]|nr:biotin--[acetyl-CoA-carboxylase] ligase [Alicyclobacillaceae bacterium]